MIFRRTVVGLVVFISSIVVACSFMGGAGDARTLAEKFLDDRLASDSVGNEAYYSDIFWKYTQPEDWRNIKEMVETRLGALQSYRLKTWKVQKNVKMGELSGTFVVLLYAMQYEYGRGQEKITLMKGLWDTDFQIIGHNFDSDIFA